MSYGIIPYMTSLNDVNSIWNSKIEIAKSNVRSTMQEKLGFKFLPRETSTEWLKTFNKAMKKEYGYLDFRAHVAMQDLFNGELTYKKTPWIYSYLLEGIVFNLASDYFYKVVLDFKEYFPDTPTRKEDYNPSDELLDYLYSRILLRSRNKSCHLPNSEWYPCDLSIINYLPSSLPMPIPEADDFPFVSSIRNGDLEKVLNEIDFSGFSKEGKEQMTSWFTKTQSEKRDLVIFIY